MKRREFITLLGGVACVAACGARAAADEAADHRLLRDRRGIRPGPRGPPRLCSGCTNSVGSKGAPSRSSIAGRRDAPSAGPRSRRIRPAQGRCHCQRWQRGRRGKAGVNGHSRSSSRLVDDPVGMGLVASLARPGGNVTGLAMQSTDLVGKRLALLREVVPGPPPVGDHGQCRISLRRTGNG